ncbi:MAG TPA: alanine racemase [Porticoccaceae bacterium]|nr:alanine racemase [Porticoccaceae bacterium]
MSRPAEALINLSYIRSNFARAAELAGPARVMAVIKADAYGHGAVRVAQTLGTADCFGVASLDEACMLRAAGISQPIVVLGGVFADDEWPAAAAQDLQVVIHSGWQLEGILRANLTRPLVVWLKHDSGMHRLGLDDKAFSEALGALESCDKVSAVVAMSHLACADSPGDPVTAAQVDCFEGVLASWSGARSMANSAALMTRPQCRYEWVRPGLMLYGAQPLISGESSGQDLMPAMTLRSKVVALREVAAGEGVGYGLRWQAKRPSLIATVAMGYGDGYPRHAPDGTPVLINGVRAPLVGRVSMDFVTVDVSALQPVSIGDTAVFWGEGLPVEEVAAAADTLAYQLLTAVSQRVRRIYQG